MGNSTASLKRSGSTSAAQLANFERQLQSVYDHRGNMTTCCSIMLDISQKCRRSDDLKNFFLGIFLDNRMPDGFQPDSPNRSISSSSQQSPRRALPSPSTPLELLFRKDMISPVGNFKAAILEWIEILLSCGREKVLALLLEAGLNRFVVSFYDFQSKAMSPKSVTARAARILAEVSENVDFAQTALQQEAFLSVATRVKYCSKKSLERQDLLKYFEHLRTCGGSVDRLARQSVLEAFWKCFLDQGEDKETIKLCMRLMVDVFSLKPSLFVYHPKMVPTAFGHLSDSGGTDLLPDASRFLAYATRADTSGRIVADILPFSHIFLTEESVKCVGCALEDVTLLVRIALRTSEDVISFAKSPQCATLLIRVSEDCGRQCVVEGFVNLLDRMVLEERALEPLCAAGTIDILLCFVELNPRDSSQALHLLPKLCHTVPLRAEVVERSKFHVLLRKVAFHTMSDLQTALETFRILKMILCAEVLQTVNPYVILAVQSMLCEAVAVCPSALYAQQRRVKAMPPKRQVTGGEKVVDFQESETTIHADILEIALELLSRLVADPRNIQAISSQVSVQGLSKLAQHGTHSRMSTLALNIQKTIEKNADEARLEGLVVRQLLMLRKRRLKMEQSNSADFSSEKKSVSVREFQQRWKCFVNLRRMEYQKAQSASIWKDYYLMRAAVLDAEIQDFNKLRVLNKTSIATVQAHSIQRGQVEKEEIGHRRIVEEMVVIERNKVIRRGVESEENGCRPAVEKQEEGARLALLNLHALSMQELDVRSRLYFNQALAFKSFAGIHDLDLRRIDSLYETRKEIEREAKEGQKEIIHEWYSELLDIAFSSQLTILTLRERIVREEIRSLEITERDDLFHVYVRHLLVLYEGEERRCRAEYQAGYSRGARILGEHQELLFLQNIEMTSRAITFELAFRVSFKLYNYHKSDVIRELQLEERRDRSVIRREFNAAVRKSHFFWQLLQVECEEEVIRERETRELGVVRSAMRFAAKRTLTLACEVWERTCRKEICDQYVAGAAVIRECAEQLLVINDERQSRNAIALQFVVMARDMYIPLRSVLLYMKGEEILRESVQQRVAHEIAQWEEFRGIIVAFILQGNRLGRKAIKKEEYASYEELCRLFTSVMHVVNIHASAQSFLSVYSVREE